MDYKRQFPIRNQKRYNRACHKFTLQSENENLVVRRQFPGKGFHHFLTIRDVQRFIELLPEWPFVIDGIDYVLLARGEHGCDGWYDGKVIAINAWEKDWWRSVPADYFEVHREVFSRLGIETIKSGPYYLCKFEPASIRAFQLLHVFLHELGHHFDKMSTHSQRSASRGENFAENYASSFQDLIWLRYSSCFSL